ncbi:MAG: phosphate signaling complex protein PhoU [Steroidobacteraceae bacterium]
MAADAQEAGMDSTPELEGHISRAFDGALSAMHLRAVEMGGLVLLQVREAAQAYTEWDHAVAQDVLRRERAVNEHDDAVDREALSLIARRQPVAGDLRTIIALSKVVAEFERAGDEAKKIALTVLGAAGRAGEKPGPATARDARHLARLAVNMQRLALDALDRLDVRTSAQVIALDRELDEEYAAGMRRLLTRAAEDSRYFAVALEAAFVLKSLERIGDHARNVARLVASSEPPRAVSPPCAAAR